MKLIFFFFLMTTIKVNIVSAKCNDSLLYATKAEFESAIGEVPLFKDDAIKKQNGVIKIGGCHPFKDVEQDDEFYEFAYAGDIGKDSHLKVLQKQLYNGEVYLLIDTKHECKVVTLLGKPHVYGSLIVNFNESETTDRKRIIEVWRIAKDGVFKKGVIYFNRNLEFVGIRFVPGKYAVLKDANGKYWKFYF